MASQADVRAIDLAIEANQTASVGESYVETYSPFDLLGWGTPPIAENPQAELTMWDKFLGSITPESHAESVVNRVYGSGNPADTLKPDPFYNKNDLSSPNVYVQAKGAVKETVSALTGFAKYGIIAVIGILLLAIILHAAVTGYARR